MKVSCPVVGCPSMSSLTRINLGEYKEIKKVIARNMKK